MKYTTETRGRFGKWIRNFEAFDRVRDAIDHCNTEIVDGFETASTIRIVDSNTGRVIDPTNESDL